MSQTLRPKSDFTGASSFSLPLNACILRLSRTPDPAMSHPESRSSTSSTRSSSSNLSAVDHDKEWLPQLIAKYGGSLSTAWIEERYSVWRGKHHQQSNPRVQGYLARGKFYFAWGNPICRDNDDVRREVAHEFVEWCTKEKHKKVVWCCVDGHFADILGKEMEWSVLSCVREDLLRESVGTLCRSYLAAD